MSTRAVYGFKDESGQHWVYIHHDGYPTGAAQYLKAWRDSKLHWELPRFEADEAAAGFIAANKDCPGSVRCTTGPEAHGDIEYAYLVTQVPRSLALRVEAFNGDFDSIKPGKAKPFYSGPLDRFIERAGEIEKNQDRE